MAGFAITVWTFQELCDRPSINSRMAMTMKMDNTEGHARAVRVPYPESTFLFSYCFQDNRALMRLANSLKCRNSGLFGVK